MAVRNPAELLDSFTELIKIKKVGQRSLEDKDFKMTIFKYTDGSRIKGDARLARGLIIAWDQSGTPYYFNMPMHKFDELARFSMDKAAFHK